MGKGIINHPPNHIEQVVYGDHKPLFKKKKHSRFGWFTTLLYPHQKHDGTKQGLINVPFWGFVTHDFQVSRLYQLYPQYLGDVQKQDESDVRNKAPTCLPVIPMGFAYRPRSTTQPLNCLINYITILILQIIGNYMNYIPQLLFI